MTIVKGWGVSRGPAKPEAIEEVIDPDQEIIDAHHHLWDDIPSMQRESYQLMDLAADLASGHNVTETVFVEADARYRYSGPEELRPVGETEFVGTVIREAEQRGIPTRIAGGIVAHANMNLGAGIDAVLDAHEEFALGRLRGIRDMAGLDRLNVDAFRHRLGRPEFREGLKHLAARNLTFDVYVFQVLLPDLIETVRALPEVTFVLNHLGGVAGVHPWRGRREELFPRWQNDMATLAREQNVYLKLGGMNMFIPAFDWHKGDRLPSSQELVDATGRFFDHGIQCFGPSRCMFESNFSPDALSGSYRTLWNSFKIITRSYSSAEKADMFAETARRVYRL